MRIRIYPYKLTSLSAKRLRDALNSLLVRPNGNYRPRENDLVVNWGNSENPSWNSPLVRWLNPPEAVARAADKILTFTRLREREVPTLDFTTDRNVASGWTGTVYVRHKTKSHSGDGIEVVQRTEENQDGGVADELNTMAERLEHLGFDFFASALFEEAEVLSVPVPMSPLPTAPLYTRGIENHGEYRVHVFDGEVIDYRKKSRTREEDGEVDVPTPEENAVRTLGNGWIYRQGSLNRLERVESLALQAIAALELDFGAVDIIMDEHGDVFVLEVNTAVGLADATLENYLTAIREYDS